MAAAQWHLLAVQAPGSLRPSRALPEAGGAVPAPWEARWWLSNWTPSLLT